MPLRRPALSVVLLTILAGASCNDFALPKVETAATAVDAACMDVITRVFNASGLVPVSLMVNGPPMLFAPRTTAPLGFSMTLGWAMGVSFPGGGEGDSRTCNFRLQTLSTEPDCMPQACVDPGPPRAVAQDPPDVSCYGLSPTCPLSPIGGVEYGRALREMNRRINEALHRRDQPRER